MIIKQSAKDAKEIDKNLNESPIIVENKVSKGITEDEDKFALTELSQKIINFHTEVYK